jgi:hypothetical protein
MLPNKPENVPVLHPMATVEPPSSGHRHVFTDVSTVGSGVAATLATAGVGTAITAAFLSSPALFLGALALGGAAAATKLYGASHVDPEGRSGQLFRRKK